MIAYSGPLLCLDFGELIVIQIIIRIHIDDLGLTGRAQYLNNFDQLIDIAVAHKKWLPLEHLQEHTAGGPHINHGCVVHTAKYQLRRAIAPRTDVGDIWLALYELFS
jgi:hypothetical protein